MTGGGRRSSDAPTRWCYWSCAVLPGWGTRLTRPSSSGARRAGPLMRLDCHARTACEVGTESDVRRRTPTTSGEPDGSASYRS